MANKPKIKVAGPGWSDSSEPLDFECARLLPFSPEMIISADDQVVSSFEELEHLIEQEPYRNRDFLEIILLPMIEGG
jgi:hypothetical protein